MTGGEADPATPVDRHWPAGHPPPPDQAVHTRCAGCGLRWAVHVDLGGFRLRCECGAWLQVPRRAAAALPDAGASTADQDAIATSAAAAAARDDDAPAALAVALARSDADRPSDPRVHKRGLEVAITELVLLAIAFLGPAALVQLGAGPRMLPVLLPFAALASGLLVLSIGAISHPRALVDGVRGAAARYWFEALLATALFLVAATGWRAALEPILGEQPSLIGEVRAAVGLEWALFTIALCPAVFEELAFRGLVHSRLTALFGTTQGLLFTATAFGVAHGLTLAFPLHLAIGVYLGWLRLRAGSIVPGVLLHLLYNGTLVVLEP